MSLTRRMIAVGLPAAGVTVLAALALSGAPAAASSAAGGTRPVVMATPCAGGYHSDCPVHGYGNTAPTGTAPATATGTPTATSTATGHTRGHGGYGGTSPATAPATTPPTHRPSHHPSHGPSQSPSPSPTPTGNTDTVPPGGVSPSSATPKPTTTKPGGGVSAGSALPVTGAPTGAIVGLGGLMVAAGAASVWYTRRRRNA
jgi:LPXTG-motif cell wall-anchored protein